MCNPLFEGVFIEKFLASFTEFLFRILRVRFNETCKTTPYNVRGLCLPSTDQLRRGFISCLISLSSKFVFVVFAIKVHIELRSDLAACGASDPAKQSGCY